MNEEEAKQILDNMSEQELNDFIFFALQEVEKENQKLKTELKKKDKMIDLMAIAIGNEPLPTEEYCIFRNFDCPAVGGNRDCKECVKQYFERKVEG